MEHYTLDDAPDLPSDDLTWEAFQPISDILQPPYQRPSPDLEDIPLPCRMEEISSDSDLQAAGDHDPTAATGTGLLANKAKGLQTAVLECKVCGKIFSSVSSLNKHGVSHSQERSHVCQVCTKAFKRQDHLMAHMLTHLKVKPFACTEAGCNKSYCDFRSLRRHHELHHGLWTISTTASSHITPGAPSVPQVLPNSDLIRCLLTGIIQQKVTSDKVVIPDHGENNVPQTVTTSCTESSERFTPTYTLINSTSKTPLDPASVNPLWNAPHKIQTIQHQQNSHPSGSYGNCVGPFAGHPNILDHRYSSPAAINGHETSRARDPVTRFIIQPCQRSEFQDPTLFLPLTSSESYTSALSPPNISMAQWAPNANGIASQDNLQKDPQRLSALERITGGTEHVTNGSQEGPKTVQPTQENPKSASNKSERWLKAGESQRKDKLSLSSTVLASQVALESFLASDKSRGNQSFYSRPVSNQGVIGEGHTSSWQFEMGTTGDTTGGHLVIPVSVPVTKTEGQKEDKVTGFQCHLPRHSTKRGKTPRPCPQPLYIPPPDLEKISGCFQSSMRSPNTPLSEYLNSGPLQCQYTPPPMLSPIRHGTGLYFNTFSNSFNTKCQPPCVDGEDAGGPCLSIDNTAYSVQPHINIGDQFQAVIPECRDRSGLEGEEEKADLVWTPYIHSEEMSHLLNLACSSAVPGGGCNLELALHCLHFSRANVLEALDKLLLNDHRKRLPECLADYHYAGSDHWSSRERRQFRKAYCKQRKNFSYIQSTIPKKNIYQCVEYYYTYKKNTSFDRQPTPMAGQAHSMEQSFEPQGNKEPHSGVELRNGIETRVETMYSKENSDREEPPVRFACQECDRVFDKMKSRNAHMKKHRLQEERERTLSYNSRKQSIH